ncbi:Ig-like domain-containing protein [Christiangramia flava]|uniref:Uncharacterized protein n=1 Tax=Christiangramia flava JLT2011 TaxID=1229726 RepID=A0A1L7I5B6_9FLAO|nr:Ig-like domain-containing protein [Christiangramia flava]APU68414.1 hypothetical protein GRFL_1690 [Christiangramia flava JLT2011]OSS40798.1 hypothetical protein C723_0207 [Christiangramia flava JLT2011]
MKRKIPGFVLVLALLFCTVQCAKKGTIEGGPKDEDPPKFVKANPENYTTNFEGDEIRIFFDEYIKLDKPTQQIIISPPMDPKPNIMPLGTARKDIKIEIFDTLAENTTYLINFGKSIVDNNEGNSFDYFKYVFSTGDYIDSLSVSGSVRDALEKEPKEPISIYLYEKDTSYTDSAVYQKTPRYVTYSKDSIFSYSLENLKAGTYKMVAIMDKNSNYLYNPKSEKIGFIEQDIVIPTDSTYDITVFKEELAFKPNRPSQLKGNQLLFGYEGKTKLDSVQINLLNAVPENYQARIMKVKEKDTLHYWFNIRPESDSLSFEVVTPTTRDTVWARVSQQDRDSLKVSTEPGGSIGLEQDFKISANTPIVKFSEEQMSIMDQDSAAVPFTTAFNQVQNELSLQFEKRPESKYQISLLPGAVTDLFSESNDSIIQNVSTKSLRDYGTIIMTLPNVKQYPIIVQLTDTKGKVLSEKYSEASQTLNFQYLNPGKYLVRVIFDKNENGKWDTGDFLKKRQPEIIKYYRDTLEVRANFDYPKAINVE